MKERGFPGGSAVKNSRAIQKRERGDTGSIHGSGRSPGEGNGNLLQYSCLENPHGQRSLAVYSPFAKSQAWLKWLGMHACINRLKNIRMLKRVYQVIFDEISWEGQTIYYCCNKYIYDEVPVHSPRVPSIQENLVPLCLAIFLKIYITNHHPSHS